MAVDDPYRHSDAEARLGARTLAGPNRFRTVFHMAIVASLLGAGAWAMTTDLGRQFTWVLVALMAAVSLDLFRNVHEWILPHRVTADSRGVELVWADKAPWRPWMRRHSAAIAWDQLRSVHTKTVSVNGSDTTTLYLERADGPMVIVPDGVFGQSAHAVQTAILDERDDRIEAPRREEADVAGFCQQRFESPLTLHLRTPWRRRIGGLLFGAFMLGGGLWVGMSVGGLAYPVMVGPAAFVAIVVVYATWGSSGPAVLRLSSQGVSHGPSEARLTTVPWSDVRFARPIVVNGRTVSVRVACEGGRNIGLAGDYGVSLDELARHIAPPVDYVLAMRARSGLPAERVEPPVS